jgi:WhiB family redox-sensing transcriptional regulator
MTGGRADGRGAEGRRTGSVDWRDDALCRHEDPELFFPVGTGPEAQEQTREAQAVCRRCPVREPCLEWALETGQTSGIWGGCSERELGLLRRRTLRQRRTQPGEPGQASQRARGSREAQHRAAS